MDLRPSRRQLRCEHSPTDVIATIAGRRQPFALLGEWFGEAAVFGAEPRLVRSDADTASPFTLLDQVPTIEADDGVYGGWFGYLGYQTGSLIERLPGPPVRPNPMPAWWLAWYDHVVRFDPDTGWWFESLGTDPTGNDERAFDRWQNALASVPPPRRPLELSPFVAHPDAERHRRAVRRTLDYIEAGDIYQANVCLRLSAKMIEGAALDLFAAGIAGTRARFGAYLGLGDEQAVASLSPELFLRRRGRQVVTAPIKGTRPRVAGFAGGVESGHSGDAAGEELLSADKDRAENVMIVDLMRNDLGRVCVPGTISVPRLFDLEAHPGVWHLVSEVQGELRPDVGDGALMAATMPPGSVTGAPKVRAMEIIAEVEATGREVYTGAIGGVSPVAGAEWSVAIRTFETSGDDVWIGVGGGIVADSEPEAELAECFTKAAPLVDSIGAALAAEH